MAAERYNSVPSHGDVVLRLIRGSIGSHESIHPKPAHDRFRRFCTADPCARHVTRAPSVGTGARI